MRVFVSERSAVNRVEAALPTSVITWVKLKKNQFTAERCCSTVHSSRLYFLVLHVNLFYLLFFFVVFLFLF